MQNISGTMIVFQDPYPVSHVYDSDITFWTTI